MDTEYRSLIIEAQGDGVLLVTIRDRQPGQAGNPELHVELGRVWRDVAEDIDVRAAVLTGEGETFMPSVAPATQRVNAGSFPTTTNLVKEALAIVYNIVNCDKPIVSAINGDASGAGLAAALLADISVVGRTAVLRDSHIRFGLPAGDHAAMIWPLLCGPAKAKYHLLTSTPLTGTEAERIGLVSLVVDDSLVLDTALQIASGLAAGPQHALRWTKRALNHWLRDAAPIFEASMGYEALASLGDEHTEAVTALTENRPPAFQRSVAW